MFRRPTHLRFDLHELFEVFNALLCSHSDDVVQSIHQPQHLHDVSDLLPVEDHKLRLSSNQIIKCSEYLPGQWNLLELIKREISLLRSAPLDIGDPDVAAVQTVSQMCEIATQWLQLRQRLLTLQA